MCGISGIYNLNETAVSGSEIRRINDTMIHRGPDAGQVEVFNNVALGHRRLSIIDLSSNANQPLFSDDKRYSIVFNGEVYNFKDLKQLLAKEGIKFKTTSDTEVVLKAFLHWNTKAFSMFNGMFALAIYDTVTQELYLARDTFGIKPLYFYRNESHFIFASEKKAILSHPIVNTSLNEQALAEYLWYGNPLGNNTFYQEIEELDGGCFLVIKKNKDISIQRYFDINGIKEIKINEGEAIEEIKRLFDSSIQRHLISDVPVGVFLSGGIDSSAITGYAAKHYSEQLNTYSVGFDFAKGPNELDKAAMVAKKFGTKHNEVFIEGGNTIETIEKLVDAHDEPFGDAADIPLYLLTEKLGGQIKVVLQGDGGDEFFGGYSRYHTVSKMSKYQLLKPILSFSGLLGENNVKVARGIRFISAITENDPALRNALLLTMESKQSNPFRILNEKFQNRLEKIDPFLRYKQVYKKYPKNIDKTQAIFYTDPQIILKDTFFEKVDKSTMANSIEVRVPFIDKDLTEFMLSVPASLKAKDGVQKYLLKKALEGFVPHEILYGKKTGFSVPYAYWLRTSLVEYFSAQLNTDNVRNILDVNAINKMFDLHKQGKGNYGFLLWKTLILSIWINKNGKIG